MSACPQDMSDINAGIPTDCEHRLGTTGPEPSTSLFTIQPALPRRRVKVALSFDFEAVSHWLGTSGGPENNMADYRSGIFAAQVGAYRLLDLFKKYNIADKVTWFIPGHTTATFQIAVEWPI
ncbi:hypothetical protein FE257_000958 [Aspergillus nanangensis]|uniref:Uncharacterized protein n=1 Tax=Aspergillus nanangensis TaxID=2582783 RepID=A0AAD4GPW9_ASPNN|nr:hypothetical protein FE257_000958 [Aspergillus nanangensis]